MGYDLTNIRFFKPEDSIVTNNENEGADKSKPFTYTEWLTHIREGIDPEKSMTGEYNKYVEAWNQKKQSSKIYTSNKTKYRTLLKNIALNYTTTEEKRFLTNLDYNNYRHVESAVSFFANKIKRISTYYADQRQYIKHSKKQYHTLGTTNSIETRIRNEIPKIYEELQIKGNQNVKTDIDRLDGITIVSVDKLYDVETPKPSSDLIEFTPEVFLDFERAIENLLIECTPILVLSEDLTFVMTGGLEVTQQTIEQLDYENFYNYEKRQSRLNLNLYPEFLGSLAGADMMYLSGGNILPMLEATSPWRNVLQRGGPAVHSLFKSSVKSQAQLGAMSLPQSLGLLTFYSHQPQINILDTEYNGVFPDPYKYGSSLYVSNNINDSIDHVENVTWLKADISNDGLFGDIIQSDRLPKFFGYTSETETKYLSYAGVSKQSDPYGFFRGEKNEDWANPDVFPEPPASNIYKIDERQESLLVGADTVTKWSTDIYGNEYVLLKHIKTLKDPQEYVEDENPDEFIVTSTCQIIDGGRTLRDRPPLWTELVEYKIFDGGRKGGNDPKIEQSLTMIPFEDLRQQVTLVTDDGQIFNTLEQHNTWYMGPNASRTELELTRITFHGFLYRGSQPVYDQQAYCGRFTDLGCGRVNPATQDCVVRDSYAFGTFTEPRVEIDGKTYYISQSKPDNSIEQDAYEVYFNTDYDVIDFTNNSEDPDVKIYENDALDGGVYTTQFCEELGAEIVYNKDTVPYFDNQQDVSVTQFADFADDVTSPVNTYEENRLSTGRVVFRSYNGKQLDDLYKIMSIVFDDFMYFKGSDRETIANQIKNNKIQDMDVYNDVIVIQTETHLMIQKMNFNDQTGQMLKSNLPDVLIKTNNLTSPLESSIRWCYNPEKFELVCGYIKSFVLDEKLYAHPVLFRVDMNTMQIVQTYPNNQHTGHDETMYLPQGELESYQVEHIDKPILCYNNKTQVYTLSYSCKLSGSDDVCFGFCVSDFVVTGDTFKSVGVDLHHTTPVLRYVSTDEEWKGPKTADRLIRLPGNSIPAPRYGNNTTYKMSLSATQGETIKDFEMNLTLELAGLPVTEKSKKINRVIFDPGDGGALQYVDRRISTGLEGIDYDINKLPDQSDFDDPRRLNLEHNYMFNDGSQQFYTATLTAVYADYSKLEVFIDIETEPYSLESAFSTIRLIDTNTYLDNLGSSKQILVIETDSPRYVSHVVIDKSSYNNSAVVGFVDGKPYSDSYHMMSDGRLMTGGGHSPSSKYITATP